MAESEEALAKKHQLEQLQQKQNEMEDVFLSPERLSRLGRVLGEHLSSLLGAINDCCSNVDIDNTEETSHNINTATETTEYIWDILKMLRGKLDIQEKMPKEVS